MDSLRSSVFWVALSSVVVAAAAGYTGYRIGVTEKPDLPEETIVEETPTRSLPAPVEPKPEPKVSDDEIEALLSEVLDEPELQAQFDEEAMRARQARWESMTVEQRRMMRRSMFSALAKVEGLEEVGDAIRDGKIDPREFNLDPESIADRMEFFADTMDEESMEAEVTKTLQDVVDQARQQAGQ